MKQILFLFFTFCGICPLFAQPPRDSALQRLGSPKATVRLSPNPVKNKLTIAFEGFSSGFVKLQLFDSKGVLHRSEQRRLFDGNDIVTMMFSLTPGIYMLIIIQDDKIHKKRVLVK